MNFAVGRHKTHANGLIIEVRRAPNRVSSRTIIFAVGVVLVGVVGSILLITSHAATPTASFEAEAGTRSGSVESVSDTGASGGSAVKFSAAIQTQGGWPDATNTGYEAAPDYPGSLSNCGSTIQSNTTYRFCNFASGLYIGSSSSHPTNVVFYGCRFASNALEDANVAIYGDNISFDYSTFEPSAKAAPPATWNQGYQYGIDVRYAAKVTIDHSDFWGWGNGIQFGSSTQAKPFVVQNSWFHDARDDGGKDHTDAILENYGGQSYMVFDHNTIASVGNTNGLALQAGNGTAYDHVTVTDNYFSGFGYTVNIGGAGHLTNSTFTGNTFGTDFKPAYGPLYGWNASTNTWSDNKWRVAPGTTWSAASNDGKYWCSSGSLSATNCN